VIIPDDLDRETAGTRVRHSSRNAMKIFGRMAAARSGEIDEPVEQLRPFNWLIRRVCG
jgi:hypothetical protein